MEKIYYTVAPAPVKAEEEDLAKTHMPKILRRYRDRAGLSQQQLADRVGICKSYISALELGYRAPSINLLVKISRALDARPGQMLDDMMKEYLEGK